MTRPLQLRRLHFLPDGATATIDLLPAAIAGFKRILLEVVTSRTDAAAPPPDEWDVLARAQWSHMARAVLQFVQHEEEHDGFRREIAAAAALASDEESVYGVIDDLRDVDLRFVKALRAPRRR